MLTQVCFGLVVFFNVSRESSTCFLIHYCFSVGNTTETLPAAETDEHMEASHAAEGDVGTKETDVEDEAGDEPTKCDSAVATDDDRDVATDDDRDVTVPDRDVTVPKPAEEEQDGDVTEEAAEELAPEEMANEEQESDTEKGVSDHTMKDTTNDAMESGVEQQESEAAMEDATEDVTESVESTKYYKLEDLAAPYRQRAEDIIRECREAMDSLELDVCNNDPKASGIDRKQIVEAVLL